MTDTTSARPQMGDEETAWVIRLRELAGAMLEAKTDRHCTGTIFVELSDVELLKNVASRLETRRASLPQPPAGSTGAIESEAISVAQPMPREGALADEAQAWIDYAYRKPTEPALEDAPRFTRFNMQVAFQAGKCAARASTPAQSVLVVDEMVERACRVFMSRDNGLHEDMRAAIVAAFSPTIQPIAGEADNG